MLRSSVRHGRLITAAITARQDGGWIDRVAEAEAAKTAHNRSPEYREMHRKPLGHKELGLYGGEAGFEKSPRTFVDPDRPHVKWIYSAATLSRNLRYARYGFFKRELHIIDVDKLVRHARCVPPAPKLLNDFITNKAPLDDAGCAAVLSHGRRALEQTVGEVDYQGTYTALEETFERMLVTALPPIDVGALAHAEMIRCCTAAGRWQEGEWIYERALEEAAEARRRRELRGLEMEQAREEGGAVAFELDMRFHDAAIAHCVRLGHYDTALERFADLLASGHRPMRTSLEMALTAAARLKQREAGDDVWRLFDLYEHKLNAKAFEARMAHLAMCGAVGGETGQAAADDAVATFHDAVANGCGLTQAGYAWLITALAVPTPDATAAENTQLLQRVLRHMKTQGLHPSYETFTAAFSYCAVHSKVGGAGLALALWHEDFVPSGVNVTPHMVSLLFEAFAGAASPPMILAARHAMAELERIAPASPLRPRAEFWYMQVCAETGAVLEALAFCRRVALEGGASVATWAINAVLWANARAPPPNGTHRTTLEVLELMKLLRCPPSAETVAALVANVQAHGPVPERVAAELDSVRMPLLAPDAEGKKKSPAKKTAKKPAKKGAAKKQGKAGAKAEEDAEPGMTSLLELTAAVADTKETHADIVALRTAAATLPAEVAATDVPAPFVEPRRRDRGDRTAVDPEDVILAAARLPFRAPLPASPWSIPRLEEALAIDATDRRHRKLGQFLPPTPRPRTSISGTLGTQRPFGDNY